MNELPSEPYPELVHVLDVFIGGVKNELKENFVGAYLVGSLATGDFGVDSDVDFLIITERELTDAEVPRLEALHRTIFAIGSYPAQHLEGSYTCKSTLASADGVGVDPFWYVDNGSTSLERSAHDNQWHVRWILRECGIVLCGPDPKTLMPEVSHQPLCAEMIASIEKIASHFMAEIDAPLGWFNSRFGQSFTVLTCCRALHTLKTGTVGSKLAAVQWAESSLDSKWRELIRMAWSEREGVRFGSKVRERAEQKILQDTASFLVYAEQVSRV